MTGGRHCSRTAGPMTSGLLLASMAQLARSDDLWMPGLHDMPGTEDVQGLTRPPQAWGAPGHGSGPGSCSWKPLHMRPADVPADGVLQLPGTASLSLGAADMMSLNPPPLLPFFTYCIPAALAHSALRASEGARSRMTLRARSGSAEMEMVTVKSLTEGRVGRESDLSVASVSIRQTLDPASPVAPDETFILLTSPVPLVGVSIGKNRGCPQNDSLVNG